MLLSCCLGCNKVQWTAEEYLQRSRKHSEAQRTFHVSSSKLSFAFLIIDVILLTQHILKKSAQEARVWGQLTYSQLTPAQRKHIHDRVMETWYIYLFGLMKWLPLKQVVVECPSLCGHETAVDKVLSKSLIEAKHYITRKVSKENFRNVFHLGL